MGGKSNDPDFYAVLELPRTCTNSQIRSAYRRLAMLWHPDKYAGSDPETAKLKFQEIQEAYAVLSDSGRRFLYDAGYQDEAKEDVATDYGMGDFLSEMTKMMNQVQEDENDSFEDLRTTFMKMFNPDASVLSSNIDNQIMSNFSQDHIKSLNGFANMVNEAEYLFSSSDEQFSFLEVLDSQDSNFGFDCDFRGINRRGKDSKLSQQQQVNQNTNNERPSRRSTSTASTTHKIRAGGGQSRRSRAPIKPSSRSKRSSPPRSSQTSSCNISLFDSLNSIGNFSPRV